MSFKTKVQKIVLDMDTQDSLRELKDQLIKTTSKEVGDNHRKLVMESLEEWKQGTIKGAVYDVLREMTPQEKKEIFNVKELI